MRAYDRQRLENWISDFALADASAAFPSSLRELAPSLLLRWLEAACALRGQPLEALGEPELRQALLEALAPLDLDPRQRRLVPALCGAFLECLEAEGRLAEGRRLGLYVRALKPAFLDAAEGSKPFVRPGTPVGRNDPCPCGSGQKYKKCCERRLDA